MLEITRVKHITNEEVLRRIQKDKELIINIKRRKLKYLGHIARGERFLLGKYVMKKNKKMTDIMVENLGDWYRCSSTELFTAASKVRIAMMIANL